MKPATAFHTLVAIAVILGSAAAQQSIVEERQRGMVSFSAHTVGENLGSILKVFIIISCVLMVFDAFARFFGKRLFGHGVFYVSRGIWWVYGMAVVWVLGGREYHGYPKFIGEIFGQLFSEIYEGYFGS